jgi:hypothetical protein
MHAGSRKALRVRHQHPPPAAAARLAAPELWRARVRCTRVRCARRLDPSAHICVVDDVYMYKYLPCA